MVEKRLKEAGDKPKTNGCKRLYSSNGIPRPEFGRFSVTRKPPKVKSTKGGRDRVNLDQWLVSFQQMQIRSGGEGLHVIVEQEDRNAPRRPERNPQWACFLRWCIDSLHCGPAVSAATRRCVGHHAGRVRQPHGPLTLLGHRNPWCAIITGPLMPFRYTTSQQARRERMGERGHAARRRAPSCNASLYAVQNSPKLDAPGPEKTAADRHCKSPSPTEWRLLIASDCLFWELCGSAFSIAILEKKPIFTRLIQNSSQC